MKSPQSILVTGGCGFVGSSLALRFKQSYPEAKVVCLDNLRRRGSELNIARLQRAGIVFVHGDIRNPEDLEQVGEARLILDCSAEPSVLAGYGSSPQYVLNTNLAGTINCLECARRWGSAFVFLSTSRVYPIAALNALRVSEAQTRFELEAKQDLPGASERGVAEDFSLVGARSLYGATKLASELIITEYAELYGLRTVVNRCGVLTGPWQFGKVDQGVMALWVAKHVYQGKLAYFGYGGQGKQVRDLLHVDDLFDLLVLQTARLEEFSGQTFNVGGGREVSLSLCELTELCRKATGRRIPIASVSEDRVADVRLYLSDCARVRAAADWSPKRSPEMIVEEIARWITDNKSDLEKVLA